MDFRTRREQIEKDFLRKLLRDLKAAGCPVNAKGRELIAEELRSAAMVGAEEERQRTLRILKEQHLPDAKWRMYEIIISRSVLNVLGYSD